MITLAVVNLPSDKFPVFSNYSLGLDVINIRIQISKEHSSISMHVLPPLVSGRDSYC